MAADVRMSSRVLGTAGGTSPRSPVAAGDVCVVATALTAVRDDDLVVRLGGDEFAVVGTRVRPSDRDPFASRLVDAFATPISVDEARFTVSVSVGIILGQAPETPDTLLAHADAAMTRRRKTAPRQAGCGSSSTTSVRGSCGT